MACKFTSIIYPDFALPPEVTAHNRTFRRLMMATRFWPSNLDVNADLNQLLVTLLASYNTLLERSTRDN